MVNADSPAGDLTAELVQRASEGDPGALDRVFGRHREALRRVIARRLDPCLRGRLDPSDVVQETHVEILRRMPEFLARRPMSFRNWLVRTAVQRLVKLRNQALAGRRSVIREAGVGVGDWHPHGEDTLAVQDDGPSPSEDAARRERSARLGQLLRQLSASDRAILELRTYQGLSFAEVAARLGIDQAAARKRFGRALLRLRGILVADGLTESCL
ncbi:sigma-70 family RNA polymerase sigma factor [Aquisphaera insulae]|uniref:sigma-70 family RNA polymerase sigma factor n=1 Tax=Aquisphaera insulae TaxID=2712864 RepID=UPI0013ECD9A9|nr:sigma-70 family RNA polymerase sigma factor [Aquisphaera insulae]